MGPVFWQRLGNNVKPECVLGLNPHLKPGGRYHNVCRPDPRWVTHTLLFVVEMQPARSGDDDETRDRGRVPRRPVLFCEVGHCSSARRALMLLPPASIRSGHCETLTR